MCQVHAGPHGPIWSSTVFCDSIQLLFLRGKSEQFCLLKVTTLITREDTLELIYLLAYMCSS